MLLFVRLNTCVLSMPSSHVPTQVHGRVVFKFIPVA